MCSAAKVLVLIFHLEEREESRKWERQKHPGFERFVITANINTTNESICKKCIFQCLS